MAQKTKKPKEMPNPFAKKAVTQEALDDTEDFLNRDRPPRPETRENSKTESKEVKTDVQSKATQKEKPVAADPVKTSPEKTEKVKITFHFSEDIYEDFENMLAEGKKTIRKNYRRSLSQSEFVEFLTVFAHSQLGENTARLHDELNEFFKTR